MCLYFIVCYLCFNMRGQESVSCTSFMTLAASLGASLYMPSFPYKRYIRKQYAVFGLRSINSHFRTSNNWTCTQQVQGYFNVSTQHLSWIPSRSKGKRLTLHTPGSWRQFCFAQGCLCSLPVQKSVSLLFHKAIHRKKKHSAYVLKKILF